MKKINKYFIVLIFSVIIFLFGFNHKDNIPPNTLYEVYLDSELIGTIESREELENYINNQADMIRKNLKDYQLKVDSIDTYNRYKSFGGTENYNNDKEKINYLIINQDLLNVTEKEIEELKFYQQEQLYNLDSLELDEMKKYIKENNIYLHAMEVYTPNGIEIKKIYTYEKNILTIEQTYKKIIEKKSCSIAGYKFIIKSDNKEKDDIIIYTLDTDIFTKAIEDLITIFIDEKVYVNYKKNNQPEIVTTGSRIEKVYIEEDITYKAVNISVDEKIYTNSTDLSAYLLYGDTYKERIVTVKQGDSIESITFDNQISVQEFLIFNEEYTSRDNLLVPGTDVIISTVDPKIQVVSEYYEVVDKESEYAVQEQYDENLTQGTIVITQEGKNGVDRVSQNVKSINGVIAYIDPVEKQTIQSSIPRIISIGTKYIPNVGSTNSWGWPTNMGYTISSYYGYRLAVFGEGNFHSGIDIAGTGYGSPVYASNNGTIEILRDLGNTSYGRYIMINHNNGYYSLYAHMSYFKEGLSVGSTVSRGDIIGYVGSSGWSTGPHLHYEIRTCAAYSCTTNPLYYY